MYTDNLISQVAGRNLKKLRKEAGYTNSQFAKLVNKSDQQLHRYERGVNKIDIDTLIAALKVLDVNIGDFFIQLANDSVSANPSQPMIGSQDKYLAAKLALGTETAGINH